MATVDTTTAPEGRMVTWESPGATLEVKADVPVGKMVFSDSFTVAALDAANESRVSWSLTFPPNFFYRVSTFSWLAVSTGVAAFVPATGYELAALFNIVEDGVTTASFGMYNDLAFMSSDIAAFKEDVDATVNDFACVFSPRATGLNIADFLIDATSGASQITGRWMDTSADATAAIVIQYRLEAFVYSVEQARSWQINAPQLIY